MRVPLEDAYVSYAKGLMSDSSPLMDTSGGTLLEKNLELQLDGSRRRRKGVLKDGESVTTTFQNVYEADEMKDLPIRGFSWENPGGQDGLTFLVLIFKTKIVVVDTSVSPISNGEVFSKDFPNSERINVASSSGILVVANGSEEITTIEYKTQPSPTFIVKEGRLLVRDYFGVESKDYVDYTYGTGLSVRPEPAEIANIQDEYVYNLRNQSWGTPTYDNKGENWVWRTYKTAGGATKKVKEVDEDSGKSKIDPLNYWLKGFSYYPSMSDSVNLARSQDATSSRPTVYRFFRNDLNDNPAGSKRASMGHYIIDALDRGSSRMQEYMDGILASKIPTNKWTKPTVDLPADKTLGGARVVGEYAGRVFFGGFGSEVVEGGDFSPNLSSYVLFSRVINSPADTLKCYQDNDPTNPDEADLLDDDGGYIRISGCSGIRGLHTIRDKLIVIAENGVWSISGSLESGFSAKDYAVSQIADKGCVGQDTVVSAGGTLYYWALDGIYAVGTDETGQIVAKNISEGVINNFYKTISPSAKKVASGVYDKFTNEVRWLYDNTCGNEGSNKELILNLMHEAFTFNEVGDEDTPNVCSSVIVPPFSVLGVDEPVVFNGVDVLYLNDPVVYQTYIPGGGTTRGTLYIVCYELDEQTNEIEWGFASYDNPSFIDFEETGNGVDAEALAISGYIMGEDIARQKQSPYLHLFFDKTEDGFEVDGNGDVTSISHESSCIVQAQWDWNISDKGGKWSKPFQGYRPTRGYVVDNPQTDTYDTGESVIVTRNKLPGRGRSVSIKVSSEPGKDLRLLGWSISLNVNAKK